MRTLATLFILWTGVTLGALAQDDIDPGDLPDFTPPPPASDTVKTFPGTAEAPTVIRSADRNALIVTMPTRLRRSYDVETSSDLENWRVSDAPITLEGNGSLRSFIHLASEVALFVRVLSR